MKIVLAFFLIHWSCLLFAQEQMVEDLYQGACWLDQKGGVKVASFNDRQAFNLLEGDLKEITAESAKQLPFYPHQLSEQKYDVYLHCGALGASIVMSFHGENSACVWAKFRGNSKVLYSVGLKEDKSTSFCDGHKIGEFILAVKDEKEIPSILETLKHQPSWGKDIEALEKKGPNLFLLKFSGPNSYKMDQLKSEATTELNQFPSFRYLEYNSFQHGIGEFRLLQAK